MGARGQDRHPVFRDPGTHVQLSTFIQVEDWYRRYRSITSSDLCSKK